MRRTKFFTKALVVAVLGMIWLGFEPPPALAAGSCDFCLDLCPTNPGAYCRANCTGSVGASCSNNMGSGCTDEHNQHHMYQVTCTLPD